MPDSESKFLLPAGHALERVIARRGSIQALRARSGSASFHLRLESAEVNPGWLAELALLAAVDHPGLAAPTDYGALPGGGRFLARNWIEGEDLANWARHHSGEELGALVAQLCPALDHLHRAGIVHGHLTPENVIVTHEGRPVLCDFGLSDPRRLAPALDSDESGTFFAQAPENLLGMERTSAADLFALGTLLHRLLAGVQRGAREFYAAFPARSYLDAAGGSPEDLPAWARDLIVSLTARDPNRRPRSAGAVGRQLSAQLGVALAKTERLEDLRWPVAFGRDGLVSDWMGSVEVQESALWVRVPDGEDPRPLWSHLRLFAALRGKEPRAVDLTAELDLLEHGLALDRWAAALAASGAAWLAVLVTETDAWHERALVGLERACALERRKRGSAGPRLLVVASQAPFSSAFQAHEAAPVSEDSIARFLERPLASESLARRRALAARLAAAAQGSASRLDALLVAAQRGGWVSEHAGAFRLRPGEPPSAAALGLHAATAEELVARTPAELAILCALQAAGGRSASSELLDECELDARAFGTACLALRRDGWIDGSARAGETRLQRDVQQPVQGIEALRAAHERRARRIESAKARKKGSDRARHAARVALHRFCAGPKPDTASALVRALGVLREHGRAEIALALLERAEPACALLGTEVARSAPELLLEGARAWCVLGRSERALERLGAGDDALPARVAAWTELVRAETAARGHETEQALALYARAAEREPGVRVSAALGRARLLHALAKDEEVGAELALLSGLERAGEAEAHERAALEALGAMSACRLGRVDEARATLQRLAAEADTAGNPARRAALHLDRAQLERGAGDVERARHELEQAAALCERAGLGAELARARAELGGLLREQGMLVEAEPLLLSAVELRERLDDRDGAGAARGALGLLYFERGHARAAIETLESTAESLSGSQKRRSAPLYLAKAAEMRARLGDFSRVESVSLDQDAVDPRILLARARIEWLRGERDRAKDLAGRAAALAGSLAQPRLVAEAESLAARIAGHASAPGATRVEDDSAPFDCLRSGDLDEAAVLGLAAELERRGRDDRAARLYVALAARSESAERSRSHSAHAEAALERCADGLSGPERTALERSLLGEPDPWPGDFTARSDTRVRQEDLEMEIVSLLEINRQLVQQQDLDTLLGLIVEHALGVTGAERGFLVLEEHGELRFDTALDSRRGDIARPEFEISGSVVREALARMAPVRVGNAVDDPTLANQISVVSLELRSILCVPFEIARDLRGAIYVDHRLRKGAFDDRAERLCRLLADQAALAILQVKRMEEIRALNRELERRVVEKEVDLQTARRALREAGTSEPGALVGQSPALRRVQELIARAAPSDLPVLILGESGTGKELAARALHEQSPRRRAAFISENCAALPASLIESELFGYRKGAFTGADRNRSGLFEQAAGGTLFLDEIGELPLDLQAKFLRVLETSEVRRLGEDVAHKVDFRLIVATNRDLEHEVREGRFRQDLYYRVAGLQLRMPALAERAEDIELLVEHFLHLEAQNGKPRRRVSKRVLAALARRQWPGNVRELRNEVARLCVMSEGDLDDPALVSRPATFSGNGLHVKEIVPISELEKRAIHSALEKTGGDKRKAAELLGISRAKIYQRLKDWEAAKE